MKILHTSDWHLGHRLHEQSQHLEQSLFLDWLINIVKSKNIDVLLIAGDIFDTGHPSAQSMELFYSFLAKLYKQTDCKHIIITGGNHDSPGTLNAPSELVKYFSINIIGKATENISDEILSFKIGDENLIVAAVPFLRDRDIRKSIENETITEIESRYKKALVNHYQTLADEIKQKHNSGFTIAMGHLFAIGGETSDSEHKIYVGGLGDIAVKDFPKTFDYIALGHLHRVQKLSGKENIRYSGSPFPLSFSEISNNKKVIIIETKNEIIININEVTVPTFRNMYSVKGNLDECKQQLHHIAEKHKNDKLTPWVEVFVSGDDLKQSTYLDINSYIKDANIKVLKVRTENNFFVKYGNSEIENEVSIEDLNPEILFKNKCEEKGFNLDDNPEILDAFHEILNIINEND